MGAATDAEGSYTILNVPLENTSAYIGYKNTTTSNVEVKTNLQDFSLSIAGEAVTIVGERIEFSATNSVRSVGFYAAKYVEGFMQAGPTITNGNLHIRGSRAEDAIL